MHYKEYKSAVKFVLCYHIHAFTQCKRPNGKNVRPVAHPTDQIGLGARPTSKLILIFLPLTAIYIPCCSGFNWLYTKMASALVGVFLLLVYIWQFLLRNVRLSFGQPWHNGLLRGLYTQKVSALVGVFDVSHIMGQPMSQPGQVARKPTTTVGPNFFVCFYFIFIGPHVKSLTLG